LQYTVRPNRALNAFKCLSWLICSGEFLINNLSKEGISRSQQHQHHWHGRPDKQLVLLYFVQHS